MIQTAGFSQCLLWNLTIAILSHYNQIGVNIKNSIYGKIKFKSHRLQIKSVRNYISCLTFMQEETCLGYKIFFFSTYMLKNVITLSVCDESGVLPCWVWPQPETRRS